MRSIINKMKIISTNETSKNIFNACSYFTSYLIFYDLYFYLYFKECSVSFSISVFLEYIFSIIFNKKQNKKRRNNKLFSLYLIIFRTNGEIYRKIRYTSN